MTRQTRAIASNHARAWFLLAAAAATLGACAPSTAAEQTESPPAPPLSEVAAEPTLEEVRALTDRFRNVDVALAEGYIRDPMNICDTAEMMGRPAEYGVMGIHFFRPDLLGITGPPDPRVTGTGTHTDFRQPSILIYEPRPDGSLELVAVENLVFIKAWEAGGNQERPAFQGRAYDLMADDPSTPIDEAHHFEPHYDLHVWLYRENPNGMFAQFNPNATCRYHTGAPSAHAH
jgi:hypothetical protein